MTSDASRSIRSDVKTTAQSVALTVTGALPAFLTSALAVQVRGQFGLGPAAIGVMTAVLFTVSAACSPFTGRLVQRRGARFGYITASCACALALLLIATAAALAELVAAFAIGGVANALAQPTANLLLSQGVSRRRLGIAMGLKQSYIPIASILGGLSIPAVALRMGWRWSIGAGCILTVAVLVWGAICVHSGTRPPACTRDAVAQPGRAIPRRNLYILSAGAGAGAAAATAMGVFLVDSGVDSGGSAAGAGYLLATCSVVSLTARVGLGWVVDRRRSRHLYVYVASLMFCSTVGYGLLATGDKPLFVAGALVGYLGWSWTGLFHLAIVNGSEANVAGATGIIQSGLALGAAVGPLAFGTAAEWASYHVAWVGTAVVGALAATVIRIGARGVPAPPSTRAGGSEQTTARPASGHLGRQHAQTFPEI